jgi:cysteine desulfurase
MIYLDNNATTMIRPEVVEVMSNCWREHFANPASQHRAGRRAQRALEDARESIAQQLGANASTYSADRVIFTSGGTEGNNLALFGLNARAPGKIIVSSIEHPSILGAAVELARRGVDVQTIRATNDGVVDSAHLAELLEQSPTRLVSVMMVNNETGVLQPIEKLSQLCAAANVPLHTDAVQAVGKINVTFRDLNVAAMTVTPHKFHGPVGIGALLVRSDVAVTPMLYGGSQQLSSRPGTEPVALVTGMRCALELATQELDSHSRGMAVLRDRFEAIVTQELTDAVFIGRNAQRAPHTTCVAFPGVDRQAALMALDLAGIACSTGSACASGSSEPSPALLAMGCPHEIVQSALRFSVSVLTKESEVLQAAQRVVQTIATLRR